MAQLRHLRPSLLDLDQEKALALIKTIRSNRRIVREQRAAAFAMKEEARKTRASAKKPKSAVDKLSLDSMSSETLEAIIGLLSNMLEPGETNGEDSVQDEGASTNLN
jgi:hypothetical protein